MFIIRTKSKATSSDGGMFMKTTLGLIPVGFATEQLAQSYARATGHIEHIETISRDDLLAANPRALDGVEQVLLIPSLEALRLFLQQLRLFHLPIMLSVYHMPPNTALEPTTTRSGSWVGCDFVSRRQSGHGSAFGR